jgi:hypothetical protein
MHKEGQGVQPASHARLSLDEAQHYTTHSWLQVTTEEQRSNFIEALDAMEDWLYEDEADEATADTFIKKMDELQLIGDPIKDRVYELQRRPDRVQAAKELTDLVAKAANSWPESKPWLNSTLIDGLRFAVCILWLTLHIPWTGCQGLRIPGCCPRFTLGIHMQSQDFRTWLDEKSAAQDAHPLHEAPLFTVAELQSRFEPVSKLFALLNSVPAPKPPPAPKEVNATAPAANATAENATATDEAMPDSHPEQIAADGHQEAAGGEAQASATAPPTDPPHEELR